MRGFASCLQLRITPARTDAIPNGTSSSQSIWTLLGTIVVGHRRPHQAAISPPQSHYQTGKKDLQGVARLRQRKRVEEIHSVALPATTRQSKKLHVSFQWHVNYNSVYYLPGCGLSSTTPSGAVNPEPWMTCLSLNHWHIEPSILTTHFLPNIKGSNIDPGMFVCICSKRNECMHQHINYKYVYTYWFLVLVVCLFVFMSPLPCKALISNKPQTQNSKP